MLQTVAQGVVDVLGFQVAVINSVDAYGYVEAWRSPATRTPAGRCATAACR